MELSVHTRRKQPPQTEKCLHISLEGLKKSDAVEFARDHARSLGFVKFLDRDVESLAEVSDGNPQVIKLALGLVMGGTISLADIVEQLRRAPQRRVQENLELLFARSWDLLSNDARKLLLITTLFVGTKPSHKRLAQRD